MKKQDRSGPRAALAWLFGLFASLFLLGSSPARADGFDPGEHRLRRSALEAGAGLVGGVGTGLAAGALTWVIAAGLSQGRCHSTGGCLADALLPAAVVGGATYFLAAPLWVKVTGGWSGANGTYLASLAGMAAGSVTGLGLGIAIDRTIRGDALLKGLVIGSLLGVAGAVAGYELSTHARSSPGAGPAPASRPSFVSTLRGRF